MDVYRVVSFDPGTRNCGVCRLVYSANTFPKTMEEFLGNISLEHLAFCDLGTAHVNVATAQLRVLAASGGQLAFLTEKVDYSACIEKQGSVSSPINALCHAIHGFLLGIHTVNQTTGSVYVDYEAAKKFRGDWIRVPPKNGIPLDLENGGYSIASDPVKRAAVEVCDRMMTWFNITPQLTEAVAFVKANKRQHDMADCVLQAVSYMFTYQVRSVPDVAC